MNMTDSGSSKERLLDLEHFRNMPAGFNSVVTSLYNKLESWSSVAKTCYIRNLEKFENSREWLNEQINLPEWGFPEDWDSVQGMFYVTLITVLTVSLLIISLNIYRKIRYSIPTRVNCWFCNNNTKVSYPLRETWTCPTCHQYNGFTSDGNYNKRIQAQFIEALNCPIRGCPAEGYQPKPDSNGLCSQCNLNQVLKVFQLSSFVAVNERNYDAEIEAEQKRLEKLYDICRPCKLIVEATLKRTPEKQHLVTNLRKRSNQVASTPSAPSRETNFRNEKMFEEKSDKHSTNSVITLHNLKIGSNNRRNNFEDFHARVAQEAQTRCLTPQPQRLSSSPNFSSPLYASNPSLFVSSPTYTKEITPLWKDYPMVRNRVSPTHSMIDTMSCPPAGRPVFAAYNSASRSPSPTPSQNFCYQSSNVGSVFGGSKPMLSPPKFIANNGHYQPYIRYGAYYDVSAAPGGSSMMFNSQFFSNPISRSSSQSSGFVSQQGGANSPPPQPSTPNGFYMLSTSKG
ncbi:unnamed protein product [Orchesella dallaii]|uniref:Ima1 N-terminal domain-containing protein n=1 Tax=Orchesella dallaii TaxID=48710 RepID=A0ABP1QPN1_9HEXA